MDDLYQIADEPRVIANLGLLYSSDVYNRERYEKVLSASARLPGLIEQRLRSSQPSTSRSLASPLLRSGQAFNL